MSRMSAHRICTFSTFGKSRKTSKTLDEIVMTVQKNAVPGTSAKDYSVHKAAGFWLEVCKDLQVPNTVANRKKIVQASLLHSKDVCETTGLFPLEASVSSTLINSECASTSEKDVCETADLFQLETSVSSLSNFECASTNEKDVFDTTSFLENVSPASSDFECATTTKKSLEKELTLSPSSTSSTGTVFTHELPPQPCFFFIQKKDWQWLRQNQRGRLFQGLQWTNVIAKGIKSVHPYCSFGFKRHCVKTKLSKKPGPFFSCVGYCRFEHCPVRIHVEVADEHTLKATVVFSGGRVCHNTHELKRRPVRADARQSTSRLLQTKLPRSLYLESMQNIPPVVFKSGCRDDAPTKEVLKNITWTERKNARPDADEFTSLQKILNEQPGTDKDVLQKILMHPKGIMLWSKQTIAVFYRRSREDIVYLDATGSVVHQRCAQSAPFYIYELVIRNPSIGASPLPVATFVTCDHTTSSVTYFLQSFQTDVLRMYGSGANKRPVMVICDGSLVLMQSIAITFCRTGLEDLLQKYFLLVTGQFPNTFDLPILHRCLSHIMKNAKDLCKKKVPAHYKLGMHVFGLLACCGTLKEMDEVVCSSAVLFCSPCNGPNVQKHYDNIQLLLGQKGTAELHDKDIIAEDYKNDDTNSPLMAHFQKKINSAVLDLNGDCNIYHAPDFILGLAKYFLPYATLWSGMMLGDLGRHGTGPIYENLTKRFQKVRQSTKQNFTQNNRTQGIMEKSQWDLKQIRLERRHFSRLDDFIIQYKMMHDSLLMEYADSERCRKHCFQVETEVWQKRRKRRGVYVSPILDLSMKKSRPSPLQAQSPDRADEELLEAPKCPQLKMAKGLEEEDGKMTHDASLQLTTLWQKRKTEVVVSVIPSQIRGNSYIIHHADFQSLRPHNWLTGEIIESVLQHFVNIVHVDKKIYIMNHYTAGVILSGDRTKMRRQSLSNVNFADYFAILSFINIQNNHWKLLYINAVQSTVYLVDPSQNSAELEESDAAASKLCQYFQRRTIHHRTREWVDIKFKGAAVQHPVQQDGNSCGVIVIKMAKSIMETFPEMPKMTFGTATHEMAEERVALAKMILKASVFDAKNHCAMCAAAKPPSPGPSMTSWIQCDSCNRWYHARCLQMGQAQLALAKEAAWDCSLCSS